MCLLAAGCSAQDWPDGMRRVPGPDDVVALIPWFTTMAKHVAPAPLHSWCAADRPDCRQPVPGTVPITGVEPAVSPAQMVMSNAPTIGRTFTNPVAQTAESIERGRDRYEIYCALCHGTQGDGAGQINQVMGGFIPSLVTPGARGYPDGYLYAMIVHGRGVMKAYGHRVRGEDRWHVVNYIRVLQGTAQ